jgi:hypothetical protein
MTLSPLAHPRAAVPETKLAVKSDVQGLVVNDQDVVWSWLASILFDILFAPL